MSSGAFNDIEMSGTTEEAGTRKAFLSWPPHPVASSNPATISPIATGTTPTSCEPSHHEIAAQGLKPPSRTGHLASAGVKIMGQSASDKASSHISFGAPTSEASTSSMVDPTMIEQATRLNALINEVSPTVTRAVFRQRWREFLFDGSNRDDHATFLLKAGLKNATKPVIDRILKEESLYKGDFIQGVTQKKAVIAAVIQRATPEQLLSNVQLNIFERALERHLVTMNSRKLVRWLARAQRLGFQADDIINDDESVVPNMPELTINIPSESTSQSLPSAPPTLKGLVPTSQPSPGGQQQQGISQSHHLEQIAVPQQSLHHQTPALVLTMTGTQEQFQVSTPASISPNIPRPSIAPSPSIPPNIPTSPIGPPSQYNTSTYNNSEAVHPIQHTSTESQNGDRALPSHINESGITCRRCNFACQSMPGYLYVCILAMPTHIY